jgi:thiol:disulfide interchange protein
VSAIDANTLRASWKIHPEYYLYHDKFFIDVKGAEFGNVNFPKGALSTIDCMADLVLDNTLNALSISDLLPLTTLSVADLVIGG